MAAASGTSDRERWATLQDRRARYILFFSTYFYQGLVAGFSLTALANHYAGLGLPAREVGLHFAIAGLPWTVQPLLWGPLVDRARGSMLGRRRFWSVQACLGAQACLLCLCFVPGPPNLAAIGAVFFAHSLFASLLDTACDRMVMDHVPEAELGRMSGCTRGGFVVGTSVGAALFGWMLSNRGFEQSAILLFLLSTLALMPALLVRETARDAFVAWRPRAGADERRRGLPFARFLQRLLIGLRRPSALRLLALCFAIDFALSLFEVRFGVDMVQAHGWDASALSRLQAGLALVSGTFGALAIGIWSDRAGAATALTGLLASGAAAFAITAILIGSGLVGTAGPLILGLSNILPSLVIVALVPALMQASRGRAGAATQFEVFMATLNLGSVVGGGISGLVTAMPMTLVAGLVCAVFGASAFVSRRPGRLFGKRGRHSETSRHDHAIETPSDRTERR